MAEEKKKQSKVFLGVGILAVALAIMVVGMFLKGGSGGGASLMGDREEDQTISQELADKITPERLLDIYNKKYAFTEKYKNSDGRLTQEEKEIEKAVEKIRFKEVKTIKDTIAYEKDVKFTKRDRQVLDAYDKFIELRSAQKN